jgi:short-subunit dehydrogenase
MNPNGRVVILTGATQGIGRATAYLLAQANCKLVLAARNGGTLQALAGELMASGHQAVAVPTDLGDTAQAAALAGSAVEAYGQLDIIINNAAIGVRDRVIDLNEAEARRVMNVNYFGPVALIQSAIPLLSANPHGGLTMPGIAGYCASKSALEKMAESLRLELKARNIRVSTIFPGVTVTDFNTNSLGSSREGRGRVTGVPPERVARTILKTIRSERRDVFVTLFDYTFVMASTLLPGFVDRLLSRHLDRSGQRWQS